VSRALNGGAPIYNVWDGWNLIEEIQSGSVTAAYLSGAGGLVKNLVSGNYYYQDASGSTSHLGSGSGQLLEWYRYDLQGTPVFYNALNTQLSTSNYSTRHLFTGQQWMSELGLYDLRNRFYSPDLGRFLQPDPIGFKGDPSNIYRYCGNNPVNRSDPSGLWLGWRPSDWSGNSTPGYADADRVYVTATYDATEACWGGGQPVDNGGIDYLNFSGAGRDVGSPIYFGLQLYAVPGSVKPNANFRPSSTPGILENPFASPDSGPPATSITLALGPGLGFQMTWTYDQYGQNFIAVGGQIGKSWPVSLAVTGNSVIGQSNPSASQIATSIKGLGWSGSAGYYFGGQLSGPASWSIFNPFSNSGAGPPSNWGVGFVSPQLGLGLGYTWQGPTLANPLPPYNSPGGP
jgi:RHS repeat-associated protein